ncbi:biphenyl 2,3-dioxygenase [filamentous cyanobacterium LEGE 11480]|uniref:Biphenyl 2,3-dioxygenase n=1 Tax=Romeriopsis navalis LEGE 11480 TaxID=2777977 RepID=A0A928VUK6_9CYAN|nr:sulfocyanin-like copper-binding protein [Romeriopsis navalis]MBE9032812.1 biphenyl 2,3-dioxygenase [Romeriopsis navalis LEGE 11480]
MQYWHPFQLTAQRWLRGLLILGICWLGLTQSLWAADLARQKPIVVEMALGNATDELAFFPPQLTFESGKRYKLKLVNHSPEKHYFTAKDFADAIWSQKVDAGNVEIKGAIHELELRSDTAADWVFVAIRPGTYPLRCTIPGHAESGMTGKLIIQ